MGKTGEYLPKPKFSWRPWILSYILVLELGLFPYVTNPLNKPPQKFLSQRVSTIDSLIHFPSKPPIATNTPLMTQLPTPTPTITPKQIITRKINKPSIQTVKAVAKPQSTSFSDLINKYGGHYGVDPAMLHKIASCESGHNPMAVNGPYGGMYQFLSSTWISNRKAMGEDPNPNLRFNAEEAIKTTAFKISRDGSGAWPVCSRS